LIISQRDLEVEESDTLGMKTSNSNPTPLQPPVSRRLLLRQMVALPAALLLTSALAACGGRATPEKDIAQSPAVDQTGEPAADAGATTANACAGEDALTAQEQNMRRALNYVEQAPDERTCAACQFYTAAADGGSCGTCTILSGPIHAAGYCTTWVART
jgi:hypothetical protein